jgi:hypothetical protein
VFFGMPFIRAITPSNSESASTRITNSNSSDMRMRITAAGSSIENQRQATSSSSTADQYLGHHGNNLRLRCLRWRQNTWPSPTLFASSSPGCTTSPNWGFRLFNQPSSSLITKRRLFWHTDKATIDGQSTSISATTSSETILNEERSLLFIFLPKSNSPTSSRRHFQRRNTTHASNGLHLE